MADRSSMLVETQLTRGLPGPWWCCHEQNRDVRFAAPAEHSLGENVRYPS